MAPPEVSIATTTVRSSARVLLGAHLFLFVFSGNALASEEIPFEELGGDQCFMFSRLFPFRAEGDHYVRPPIELVINNEEIYKKLFVPEIRRQS